MPEVGVTHLSGRRKEPSPPNPQVPEPLVPELGARVSLQLSRVQRVGEARGHQRARGRGRPVPKDTGRSHPPCRRSRKRTWPGCAPWPGPPRLRSWASTQGMASRLLRAHGMVQGPGAAGAPGWALSWRNCSGGPAGSRRRAWPQTEVSSAFPSRKGLVAWTPLPPAERGVRPADSARWVWGVQWPGGGRAPPKPPPRVPTPRPPSPPRRQRALPLFLREAHPRCPGPAQSPGRPAK